LPENVVKKEASLYNSPQPPSSYSPWGTSISSLTVEFYYCIDLRILPQNGIKDNGNFVSKDEDYAFVDEFISIFDEMMLERKLDCHRKPSPIEFEYTTINHGRIRLKIVDLITDNNPNPISRRLKNQSAQTLVGFLQIIREWSSFSNALENVRW
jgi:hypothetical protein